MDTSLLRNVNQNAVFFHNDDELVVNGEAVYILGVLKCYIYYDGCKFKLGRPRAAQPLLSGVGGQPC